MDDDIWFPGKRRSLLTVEEMRLQEQQYNPEWERSIFLGFVEQHPTVDIAALAKRFSKPIEWCEDKLHYHKLEQLAAHFAKQRIICPLNALMLAKLTHEEQSKFVQQAIRMEPTDFRIAVNQFLRNKVMAVRIPQLTMAEIVAEAIVVVPKQKTIISCLQESLREADRQQSSLKRDLSWANGLDPDRFYKD